MRRRLMAAIAALCLGVSCAGEDVADPVEVAGTGSSGGNPAVTAPLALSFQLATDGDGPQPGRWLSATVQARTITLARRDADGACVFEDDASWQPSDILAFGADRLDGIDGAGLCRIRVMPDGGAPLIVASGVASRLRVLVTLWLDRGIDLVIERPPTADAGPRDFVVVFEPDRIIEGIDLRTLPQDDVELRVSDRDPALGERLLARFTDAMTIYDDPTPGDGVVTVSERTPENRVGYLELVP